MVGASGGRVLDLDDARSYVDELRKITNDVPIYVGALGLQMLALPGRHAEGAALNWCTPAQIAWSPERVGARAKLIQYIRMCVDDDVDAARLALGGRSSRMR